MPGSMWKTASQSLRPMHLPARPASAGSSLGRPLASASLGQPRPVGRYILAGRPYRPCLRHRRGCVRRTQGCTGRSGARWRAARTPTPTHTPAESEPLVLNSLPRQGDVVS
eukprot:scaffold46887_cov63-Phaeocystis_antarctica.AAC.1